MDILRFITTGNVDDGKSTLIGRLLHDTQNIKADVLQSVTATNGMNLAHITDGLRSERELGITIDVAYKYFTTKNRKYIITDAPGHFQYTRNLVTGASGVDVMIILIDAQNGITEQTRRHALVASFLQIKQVVIAINKMDALNYSEQVYTSIKDEFAIIAGQLQLDNLTFIPVSALCGDNVSFASVNMGWYGGPTLMQYLESCPAAGQPAGAARMAVQCVITADDNGSGYAGKMLAGTLKVGDRITVLPSGNKAAISEILHCYASVPLANAMQNVTVYLDVDTEVKRGDILALSTDGPMCGNQFEATLCWLDASEALRTGKEYLLRINGTEVFCTITSVISKTDIHTFQQYSDGMPVEVNEFAHVVITTRDTIAYDPFLSLPANGRGIIIDTATNYTSGAFTIS